MNDPEPHYVSAQLPKPDVKPRRLNWRNVFLQTIEIIGVVLIAVAAGTYELYLAPLILGLYLCWVANTS